MKAFKYITITLFAIVAVLWGVLVIGCSNLVKISPHPRDDRSTRFYEVSDSFYRNTDLFLEMNSKHKHDSAMFFLGKQEAYLEMEAKDKP